MMKVRTQEITHQGREKNSGNRLNRTEPQHKQQRRDRKTVPHSQARIHNGWKKGQKNQESHTRQIVIHQLTSPRIHMNTSNDKHYTL
jgi:hypothetical protein